MDKHKEQLASWIRGPPLPVYRSAMEAHRRPPGRWLLHHQIPMEARPRPIPSPCPRIDETLALAHPCDNFCELQYLKLRETCVSQFVLFCTILSIFLE